MKKMSRTVFGVVLAMAMVMMLPAQDNFLGGMAVPQTSGVVNDCQEFDNANYYLYWVILYAGQHEVAGIVKFSVQRRDGKFERLRVEYLMEDFGWRILESHLYVGTEPPAKMAPGKFPYQQESPSGLSSHQYYVDLDTLGDCFDNIYVALHAVVVNKKTGREETAWGWKTKFYPVIEDDNPGVMFGTIFPHPKKQWPAYLKMYVPYCNEGYDFDCPQPLWLIYYFE